MKKNKSVVVGGDFEFATQLVRRLGSEGATEMEFYATSSKALLALREQQNKSAVEVIFLNTDMNPETLKLIAWVTSAEGLPQARIALVNSGADEVELRDATRVLQLLGQTKKRAA